MFLNLNESKWYDSLSSLSPLRLNQLAMSYIDEVKILAFGFRVAPVGDRDCVYVSRDERFGYSRVWRSWMQLTIASKT